MSILNRIACYQNRRDEVPNQELARDLAASGDQAGVAEIAANLWNMEPDVQSDCLKVLYEIGYLRPELIASYAADFLKLLKSRNNRLVWGGMIALSTIDGVAADELYPCVADIQGAMAHGSVITIDAGIRALAAISATNDDRRAALFPYLLNHLAACRPSDVPRQAEMILIAITAQNKDDFVATLRARLPLMTPSQAARLNKVMRQAEAR